MVIDLTTVDWIEAGIRDKNDVLTIRLKNKDGYEFTFNMPLLKGTYQRLLEKGFKYK